MINGAFVEMELREIQIKDDPLASQVILLGEKGGARVFPIFIGYNEALALDMAAHGFRSERPMTHDLILNVIAGLDCALEFVAVDGLQDNTFFGKLGVRPANGEETLIDARPSDAMVLAIKRRAKIYVAESVLNQAMRDDEGE